MSGGVDSSVAAALLVEAGHDVTGVTLRLWGGSSDSGCCAATDVDDARRVAQQLGIAHHVFNLTEAFDAAVVQPYVEAHRQGRTPNPCIECNRHLKFDLLVDRIRRLGFDRLATGHHAKVGRRSNPDRAVLLRGADPLKDQSYVLSMLPQAVLSCLELPVGHLHKAEVRELAAQLGLRSAHKPDSQDVCFITSTAGREGFLAERIELHPGSVVDTATGLVLGQVPAVELVTLGQRKGIGAGPDGERRYVTHVELSTKTVHVGPLAAAQSRILELDPTSLTTTGVPLPFGQAVIVQVSAHGAPLEAVLIGGDAPRLELAAPERLVAPGQTVALYDRGDPEVVLGSGMVR